MPPHQKGLEGRLEIPGIPAGWKQVPRVIDPRNPGKTESITELSGK